MWCLEPQHNVFSTQGEEHNSCQQTRIVKQSSEQHSQIRSSMSCKVWTVYLQTQASWVEQRISFKQPTWLQVCPHALDEWCQRYTQLHTNSDQ